MSTGGMLENFCKILYDIDKWAFQDLVCKALYGSGLLKDQNQRFTL